MGLISRLTRSAALAASQPYRDHLLRGLIQGRRVLVLGSGPSARDLIPIPDDVLVFSCNLGPELLVAKTPRRRVDLYIGNRQPLEEYGSRIDAMFGDVRFGYFLSRTPRYIRKRRDIRCERVLADRGTEKSNYMLRRFLDAATVDRLAESVKRGVPSTGVALLVHALVYAASDIFLIGMDLDTRGHALGNHDTGLYAKTHMNLDHEVVRFAATSFRNVWSASEQSPVTALVPYRPLT